MSEAKAMPVHKVTLSTGKVVLVRDMEIGFEEIAAQAVAHKADGNEMMLGILMQNELIKMLIVQIDGKNLQGAEKEDLKSLLTYAELVQIRKVVAKLMGKEDKDPLVEFVSG